MLYWYFAQDLCNLVIFIDGIVMTCNNINQEVNINLKHLYQNFQSKNLGRLCGSLYIKVFKFQFELHMPEAMGIIIVDLITHQGRRKI